MIEEQQQTANVQMKVRHDSFQNFQSKTGCCLDFGLGVDPNCYWDVHDT